MYKGFILDSDLIKNKCNSETKSISFECESFYKKLKKSINESLNSINAKEILDDYFPQGEFHTFISHSHSDRDISIKFSNWLKNKFGIKAFIDSECWKYCNDLIKELENAYPKTESNYIASHVHNMLLTSLAKMIDSCEVFFFIRSQSSLYSPESTLSPWIYSELQFTNILRKDIPPRIKTIIDHKRFEVSLESFNMQYPALLSELHPLNENILEKWERSVGDTGQPSSLDSLDKLYSVIANYQ